MRRRQALLSLLMLAAAPAWAADSPFAAGEWETYAARFVRADGRVVDTGNAGVSHSEGQGYGMLLAHAAGDRPVLDLIWQWAERNLAVRGDGLFAWRWNPASPAKPVADRNSASDGDILIAWALARAAELWGDAAYLERSKAIALAVRQKLLVRHGAETLLLPGPSGFVRKEGPVVNLSYWVFPALRTLAAVDPDPLWTAVEGSGLRLLGQARFGRFALPADWTLLADPPRPAPGFPATFGYNALRIPLHLVWAGIDDPWLLAPFRALWRHEGDTPPVVVELEPPGRVEPASNRGALAIARLALAEPGAPPPALPALGDETDYFAASLTLLAKLAYQESRRR
jgi:endoglucanase